MRRSPGNPLRLAATLAVLLALSLAIGATARAGFIEGASWSVRDTIERYFDGSAAVEGSADSGGSSGSRVAERNPFLTEGHELEQKLTAALDDCHNEVWDSLTFGLAPDVGSLGNRASEDIQGTTNKIKALEEAAKADAIRYTRMGEEAAAATSRAIAKKLGWLGAAVSAKFIFDACHTRLGAAQEKYQTKYDDYVKWEFQKDPRSAYIDARAMQQGDFTRSYGETRQNRSAQNLLCERLSSVPGGRLTEKEIAAQRARQTYMLASSGYDVHPDRCRTNK